MGHSWFWSVKSLTWNETTFFVEADWSTESYLWWPSVVLGLPANLFVIFLGHSAVTLGNFCFAINCVALVNALHCIVRGIIVTFYLYHFWLKATTSLLSCTIVENFLGAWLGQYIIFFIPLLSICRYVLLSVKGGEQWLTKRNISYSISILVLVPTLSLFTRLGYTIANANIIKSPMCSFKYSDRDCKWCEQLVVYGSYISYSVSFFYSALLFHHLYVAFRRVSDVNSSRRLKDEVGILLCIVIQTALPILLTIPMNSRQYMWRLGFGRVGTAFAATLYNYSPLFDAISIIAFVKPYRRAAKRLWQCRAETEAGPRRVLQECCETCA